MNERPWSVTIIAWFLIVANCAGLAGLYAGMEWAQIWSEAIAATFDADWLLVVSLIVGAGCGAGLLFASTTARFVYIGWTGAGIGEGLLLLPEVRYSLPAIAVFLVITGVLLTEPAASYLRGDAPADGLA